MKTYSYLIYEVFDGRKSRFVTSFETETEAKKYVSDMNAVTDNFYHNSGFYYKEEQKTTRV